MIGEKVIVVTNVMQGERDPKTGKPVIDLATGQPKLHRMKINGELVDQAVYGITLAYEDGKEIHQSLFPWHLIVEVEYVAKRKLRSVK